jgi:hypothetical protein
MLLKPCPFCKFRPDTEEPDCIYPIDRERKIWNLVCYNNFGACGSVILGGSEEDCINKWETREQDLDSDPIENLSVEAPKLDYDFLSDVQSTLERFLRNDFDAFTNNFLYGKDFNDWLVSHRKDEHELLQRLNTLKENYDE